MTDSLIRQVNLRIPALLGSALQFSRSVNGSESADRALADFLATQADMPDGASDALVTFALAQFAAQMIDQLAVAAGTDAAVVIQHFAATYNASIE